MEMLQPDLIAPVVAWLCHEDCKDNGAIVEAAGGWAGKCESNTTKPIISLHQCGQSNALKHTQGGIEKCRRLTQGEGGPKLSQNVTRII